MEKQRKITHYRKVKSIHKVKHLYRVFLEFTQLEVSGGIMLMVAAFVALAWANSPWSAQYFDLWHIKISFGFGNNIIAHDLHWWINEVLMVVFFFVVGLEIKREILVGELASLRQAALPIAAAVGGMVVPAAIYAILNAGRSGISGWGIPMATDIAFALGVVALIGSRVPLTLKVFLTALAIVDDIGAMLVIAIFYSSSVLWLYLVAAAGILVILITINVLGVGNKFLYVFLGIVLWWMILNSGLHATLAGVLLAMTIPADRKINRADFLQKALDYIHTFEHTNETNQRLLSGEQQEALLSLETAVDDVEAPLQKMEHALHPWVAFAIIPLFALANAGVSIGGNFTTLLLDRVSLGIAIGMIVGKQLGVTLAAWLAVKLRLAEMPRGVSWRQIYAVGWLAGIGFTMSLFISELAFGEGRELEIAKVGILGASLLAGLIGYTLLRMFVHNK